MPNVQCQSCPQLMTSMALGLSLLQMCPIFAKLFCRPIASLTCQRLDRCRTVTGCFSGCQKDSADLGVALTHLNSWTEQAAQNMQWLGNQIWSCPPFSSVPENICFHVMLWTLHLYYLWSPITNFLCCTGNCILPSRISPLTMAECV